MVYFPLTISSRFGYRSLQPSEEILRSFSSRHARSPMSPLRQGAYSARQKTSSAPLADGKPTAGQPTGHPSRGCDKTSACESEISNMTAGPVTAITGIGTGALAATALAAFFSVSNCWKLSEEDQMVMLGVQDTLLFRKYKKDPAAAVLPRDTLERISILVSIYNDLHRVLVDDLAADDWLRLTKCSALLVDGSLLDRMLAGNFLDIVVVRQFITNLFSGWQ